MLSCLFGEMLLSHCIGNTREITSWRKRSKKWVASIWGGCWTTRGSTNIFRVMVMGALNLWINLWRFYPNLEFCHLLWTCSGTQLMASLQNLHLQTNLNHGRNLGRTMNLNSFAKLPHAPTAYHSAKRLRCDAPGRGKTKISGLFGFYQGPI